MKRIKEDLTITYFFHRPKEQIFQYWTRPELFEKWGAPNGMTLKVKKMEPRKDGKYSMVHTSSEGKFECNGYFKEFIPNEKLVQIDNILGPDGNTFFHDLECIVEFNSQLDGTEVTVTQRGFPDEKSLVECKQSWEECLNNLDSLLNAGPFKAAENVFDTDKTLH